MAVNPMTLSSLQTVAKMPMFKDDFALKLGKGGDTFDVIANPKGFKSKENKAVRQAVLNSLLTSEGKTNWGLHFTAVAHQKDFEAFLTSGKNGGESLTMGDVRALLTTLKSAQKLDESNASLKGNGKIQSRQVTLPKLPTKPQVKPSAGKSTKTQSRQVTLPKLPTKPQVKTDAKSQSPKTDGAKKRTYKPVSKSANVKMSAFKNLLAGKGFGKPNGTSPKGREVTTAPSPSRYEEVLAEKPVTQSGKRKPKKRAFGLEA